MYVWCHATAVGLLCFILVVYIRPYSVGKVTQQIVNKGVSNLKAVLGNLMYSFGPG